MTGLPGMPLMFVSLAAFVVYVNSGSSIKTDICFNKKRNCYHYAKPACMHYRSYNGTRSYTVDGIKCHEWKSNKPKSHRYTHLPKNYCRNPSGDDGPWCYATKPTMHGHWDYCLIDCWVYKCYDSSRSCFNRGGDGCYKHNLYNGTRNVALNGKMCQKWSLFGYNYLPDNYCRNPKRVDEPYCFTGNKTHPKPSNCFKECADLDSRKPKDKGRTKLVLLSFKYTISKIKQCDSKWQDIRNLCKPFYKSIKRVLKVTYDDKFSNYLLYVNIPYDEKIAKKRLYVKYAKAIESQITASEKTRERCYSVWKMVPGHCTVLYYWIIEKLKESYDTKYKNCGGGKKSGKRPLNIHCGTNGSQYTTSANYNFTNDNTDMVGAAMEEAGVFGGIGFMPTANDSARAAWRGELAALGTLIGGAAGAGLGAITGKGGIPNFKGGKGGPGRSGRRKGRKKKKKRTRKTTTRKPRRRTTTPTTTKPTTTTTTTGRPTTTPTTTATTTRKRTTKTTTTATTTTQRTTTTTTTATTTTSAINECVEACYNIWIWKPNHPQVSPDCGKTKRFRKCVKKCPNGQKWWKKQMKLIRKATNGINFTMRLCIIGHRRQ